MPCRRHSHLLNLAENLNNDNLGEPYLNECSPCGRSRLLTLLLSAGSHIQQTGLWGHPAGDMKFKSLVGKNHSAPSWSSRLIRRNVKLFQNQINISPTSLTCVDTQWCKHWCSFTSTFFLYKCYWVSAEASHGIRWRHKTYIHQSILSLTFHFVAHKKREVILKIKRQ